MTGAACFWVELSPASLLMIERRSMIATLWSPSRRPSAPYPRLEVSRYIPRAAFHRISVTVTLHNPTGVGRTLDVGATLSGSCEQDGCKRRGGWTPQRISQISMRSPSLAETNTGTRR